MLLFNNVIEATMLKMDISSYENMLLLDGEKGIIHISVVMRGGVLG